MTKSENAIEKCNIMGMQLVLYTQKNPTNLYLHFLDIGQS